MQFCASEEYFFTGLRGYTKRLELRIQVVCGGREKCIPEALDICQWVCAMLRGDVLHPSTRSVPSRRMACFTVFPSERRSRSSSSTITVRWRTSSSMRRVRSVSMSDSSKHLRASDSSWPTRASKVARIGAFPVEVVYSRASRSSMVAQARERKAAHLLSGRAPRSITLPGGV